MNKVLIAAITALFVFTWSINGKDWTEEEWKKEKGSYGWVFPHIDKNNDGKITFDEYKGRRKKPEEIEAAEQRFKKIDKDGDKKLTLEEFKATQKKRQPKKLGKKKFQPERLKAAEKK